MMGRKRKKDTREYAWKFPTIAECGWCGRGYISIHPREGRYWISCVCGGKVRLIPIADV